MKVLEFLRLSHKRFVSKSPAYFKTITNIALAASIVVAMPEFLGMMEIEVPKVMAPYVSKTVAIAAAVAAFIAKLTVENPIELTKK